MATYAAAVVSSHPGGIIVVMLDEVVSLVEQLSMNA